MINDFELNYDKEYQWIRIMSVDLRFEIKPKTEVPLHAHLQDHEIYILEGKGKFYNDSGTEEIVENGDVIYISPNEKHGIVNVGEHDFIFLCSVPYLKKKDAELKSIPNE